MALMAQFKTAYLQREVRIDAKPSADLKVGQVCTYTPGTQALVAASSLVAGSVIIAQSDMTMAKYTDGKMNVKIADHDYSYSDKVAASTTPKPVMVFVVTDVNDVITQTV